METLIATILLAPLLRAAEKPRNIVFFTCRFQASNNKFPHSL